MLFFFILSKIPLQPKKQFKVQIVGILEEVGSSIDQKCTSWKCDKKIEQGSPPAPYLDEIQKNSSIFFMRTSLNAIANNPDSLQ